MRLFCFLELSTFQSKEKNHRLFNLRAICLYNNVIQTMTEEIKNAVFEKIELEYNDVCTLLPLLPLLANQTFDSEICNKFYDSKKQIFLLKYVTIGLLNDALMGKKQVEL